MKAHYDRLSPFLLNFPEPWFLKRLIIVVINNLIAFTVRHFVVARINDERINLAVEQKYFPEEFIINVFVIRRFLIDGVLKGPIIFRQNIQKFLIVEWALRDTKHVLQKCICTCRHLPVQFLE
ncbi:hypothetical protein D3C73_1315280 [compost metagenome]